MKSELAMSQETTSALIKKYLSRVSMTLESGNYVTEYTLPQLKEAFKFYIESGDTKYCVDNYLELLDAYRDKELETYMSDLIRQYGTDYKVLGEHVRHPALTFELLNRFKKEIPKDLSHVESITEAARLYVENLSKDNVISLQEFVEAKEEQEKKVLDKDLFSEQLEALVNYDADGNVVYEDSSDEFEDTYAYMEDDASEELITFIDSTPTYVWEIGDSILFDTEKLLPADIDKVLSYIYNFRNENGFYRTFIIYNGKMKDTTIRVEDFDIDKANELVRALVERRAV